MVNSESQSDFSDRTVDTIVSCNSMDQSMNLPRLEIPSCFRAEASNIIIIKLLIMARNSPSTGTQVLAGRQMMGPNRHGLQ